MNKTIYVVIRDHDYFNEEILSLSENIENAKRSFAKKLKELGEKQGQLFLRRIELNIDGEVIEHENLYTN